MEANVDTYRAQRQARHDTKMATWQSYVERRRGAYHTVVGNLQVREKVWSAQLQNYRDILVWLPTSYEHDSRRYPVIYMHDGQNLFDQATSFAEEWGVDETMQLLGAEGIEAIIVGIPNMGPQRLAEYSPFRDVFHGQGKGERYLSFLVDTVKPLIDRDFHTLPTATHTGIMGSSMGGLISLYGFFHHPEVFGFAGVMSPSFWFADRAIYDYVRRAPFVPGRVYLDVGTREYGGSFSEREARRRSRRYYASVRRMKRILVKKGYRPVTDLMSVEERWAAHDERAWARRLPDALRFLLRGATSSALRLPSQDDKP